MDVPSGLSGYLVTRPTGPFGRLKAKKRQWYVFDDQNHQLLFYSCHTDVTKITPLGSIPLRSAAIAIVLEEDNSFVIHSEDKDYILVAETHQSMMTWVFTLQAKRSRCMGEERFTSLEVTALDNRAGTKKWSLSRTKSVDTLKNIPPNVVNPNKTLFRRRTTNFWTNNSAKVDLTESKSLEIGTKDSNNNRYSQQLSPEVMASLASFKRTASLLRIDSETSGTDVNKLLDEELNSSAEVSDAVEEKVCVLRHLNLEAKDSDTDLGKDRSGSLSGTSISGDSALGQTHPCTHARRLSQLEDELMNVKCELAKAMNRATFYKNRFVESENIVKQMEEKIEDLASFAPYNMTSTLPAKVYENHNRFLNEEVLKLSRQLQEQEYKYQTQQFHVKEVEDSLETLKRDYVFLMQSSLHVKNDDGSEATDVYLYGGSQHKERIITLLNEARTCNPTLPSLESSSRCLCHVDSLGFQHCYNDESLILHYISRQLHQHYATTVRDYQLHQLRWKEYIRRHGITLKRTKELKALVRRGIPNPLRSRVWCYLYREKVRTLMEEKGSHYYNHLCSLAPDSKAVAQNKRQISLDLLRTMPSNVRFSHSNGDGVLKMQEVLQAFCIHSPELGYCQGMNFLVAVCLLFMDSEDAFWCMVAIVERYFSNGYFDFNLIGAQTDQEVLRDLLKEKLPTLHQHLVSYEIDICTITLNWFLTVFFESAPIETVLRIWDCFLLEGPKVIFRFALAILKLQEVVILAQKDAVAVMRQLKASVKLSFDIEQLMKVAFEGLEPFPSRKELSAKQSYYSKSISERIKKLDIERTERAAKSKRYRNNKSVSMELDLPTLRGSIIECAAMYDLDKALIFYTSSDETSCVAKVNYEENLMYNLDVQLDSKVTSVCSVGDSVVLFGTISHDIVAFNGKLRKILWTIHLNDSVLCLAFRCQDDNQQLIIAGLADGTVAVAKCSKGYTQPSTETFYVAVGSSSIKCLVLVNNKLWCASGNRLVVMSLKTFDVEDTFQTSTNGMDYISLVVPGIGGVWVTLRGSSVLQLWDPLDLHCKMLFDIRVNRCSSSNQKDEEADSKKGPRITALLQVSVNLIVGTDEGTLFFYDIGSQGIRRNNSNLGILQSECIKQQELCIEPVIIDTSEVLEDNNHPRERNDSGCYSSTTVLVSRRESSIGPTDKYQFSLPKTVDDVAMTSSSSEAETKLIVPIIKVENTKDSFVIIGAVTEELSSSEMDKLVDHCLWSQSHVTIQDEEGQLKDTSAVREDARQPGHTLLPEHFHPRRLRTDFRRWSFSVPDVRQRSIPQKAVYLSSSMDGFVHRRGASVETLCSLGTSDGYEYDDFFATYTDDESTKPLFVPRRGPAMTACSETRVLIESFRAINSSCLLQNTNDNDRFNKTFDVLHLKSVEDDLVRKLNALSVEDSSRNDRLNTKRKSFNSWTSCEESKQNSSTNDASFEDDSATPTDFLNVHGGPFGSLSVGGEWENGESGVNFLKSSDTASVLSSTSTDLTCLVELILTSKIKISDKPIKCLLESRCRDELTVISCAGNFSDDEAVLKWTREGKEKLWVNDPIIEVCPLTKAFRPSNFVRARLPSMTTDSERCFSLNSSEGAIETHSSRSSSSASQILNSGIEKVQAIFSKSNQNESQNTNK